MWWAQTSVKLDSIYWTSHNNNTYAYFGFNPLLGVANNLIFLLSICCLPQTTEHARYHPVRTYMLWELTSLNMENPMISMKNRAKNLSLSDCEINQAQCEFMVYCGQTISTQKNNINHWDVNQNDIHTPWKTNMNPKKTAISKCGKSSSRLHHFMNLRAGFQESNPLQMKNIWNNDSIDSTKSTKWIVRLVPMIPRIPITTILSQKTKQELFQISKKEKRKTRCFSDIVRRGKI